MPSSVGNLPRYFSRLLRRFGGDRRGNIAVTFTFSLVPIVAGVGAAVDYSHANSVKAALQASLDATVLMLAKNAGGQTPAEMQTLGDKYFKANFNRKEAINPKIVVTYTQAKATIVVNGTASVKTDMMGILGFKTLGVAGTASAGWGVPTRLRVALVLDNTGSMNQSGKMPALQTAAKNMLARLNSASKTDGDVMISIVPFATDVNVGTKYAGANWIDWYD